MPLIEAQRQKCAAEDKCPMKELKALSNVRCAGGKAGEYDCSGVDLQSFVPLSDLGSNGNGNDIWGWTDESDGSEWAIFCAVDGTSFVDVTDTTNPNVVT